MEIIKIATATSERDCEDYVIVLRASGKEAEELGRFMRQPVRVLPVDRSEDAAVVMRFIEDVFEAVDDSQLIELNEFCDVFDTWRLVQGVDEAWTEDRIRFALPSNRKPICSLTLDEMAVPGLCYREREQP